MSPELFNRLLDRIYHCDAFNVAKGIRQFGMIKYDIGMIRIEYTDYKSFIVSGIYNIFYPIRDVDLIKISVECIETNLDDSIDIEKFHIADDMCVNELFTALEDKMGIMLL